MTPQALTDFLKNKIPLTRAIEIAVVSADPASVEIEAPLAPNINVHGTMFGGSAATLALLAAWSVLHLRLEAENIVGQLVIHKTDVEYLRPISGLARAVAMLDDADWSQFVTTLHRRGKARIAVTANVSSNGEIAARLSGQFVAILDKPSA